MVRLDLTEDQATTLLDVLNAYLGDLRMEIANTDSMDYREGLKTTEILLKELIASLSGQLG